jgi:hypothetical protein
VSLRERGQCWRSKNEYSSGGESGRKASQVNVRHLLLRVDHAIFLAISEVTAPAPRRQRSKASSSISRRDTILLDLKYGREHLQFDQVTLAAHIVREACSRLLREDEAEAFSLGDRLQASEPPPEARDVQELGHLGLLSGEVGAREGVLDGVVSVGEVRGGKVGRELREESRKRYAESARERETHNPVEELVIVVGKVGTSTLDRLCEDGAEVVARTRRQLSPTVV